VGDQLRRHAECGLPVREPDLYVLIANTVPEHIDRAPLIDLLGQALGEPLARALLLATMRLDEPSPFWVLGQLNERKQLRRVEAESCVELLRFWVELRGFEPWLPRCERWCGRFICVSVRAARSAWMLAAVVMAVSVFNGRPASLWAAAARACALFRPLSSWASPAIIAGAYVSCCRRT
jgi:hypothetical protein